MWYEGKEMGVIWDWNGKFGWKLEISVFVMVNESWFLEVISSDMNVNTFVYRNTGFVGRWPSAYTFSVFDIDECIDVIGE